MDIRKLFSPLMQVLVLVFVLDLVMAWTAMAQDGTVPVATDWATKLKDLALLVIVPALWGAVGPFLTISITAAVNQVIGAYVPRSLQIPLAGIISAVLAGFTGDGAHSAGIGLAEGMTIQSALSMNRDRFLASPPPTSPTPSG